MTARRSSLVLVALLLLLLPGLLIDLGRPGPLTWMEGISLLTSRETWNRQHSGEADAWLTPSANGAPRLRKPPMLVWLHMVAWSDFDPSTATAEALIHRARLVNVGLALLLIVSTFWMGTTLQDTTLGLFAAAIISSLFLFQQQARIASYDLPVTAFSALALGAALWGLRPFNDDAKSRGRALAGCALAAVALACAILSKGALAIALTCLPLILLCAYERREIASRVVSLGLMLASATVLSAWWFIYVNREHPQLPEVLGTEYSVPTVKPRTFPYYLNVLWWLALPWTIWLITGLLHPFLNTVQGRRDRRVLVWLWCVILLVVLMIPAAKEQRYLTPLTPALALLAAGVWRDHLTLGRQGLVDRRAWLVTLPHWLLMLAIACSMASLLRGHSIWIEQDWLRAELAHPLAPLKAIAVAAVLVVIAAIGWWSHWRFRPVAAMSAMVGFMAITSTAYWHAAASVMDPMQVVEESAKAVKERVGSAPLLFLRADHPATPSYEFVFYLNRVVPRINARRLARAEWRETSPDAFVISAAGAKEAEILTSAGFSRVLEFSDLPDRQRILWWRPESSKNRPLGDDDISF